MERSQASEQCINSWLEPESPTTAAQADPCRQHSAQHRDAREQSLFSVHSLRPSTPLAPSPARAARCGFSGAHAALSTSHTSHTVSENIHRRGVLGDPTIRLRAAVNKWPSSGQWEPAIHAHNPAGQSRIWDGSQAASFWDLGRSAPRAAGAAPWLRPCRSHLCPPSQGLPPCIWPSFPKDLSVCLGPTLSQHKLTSISPAITL